MQEREGDFLWEDDRERSTMRLKLIIFFTRSSFLLVVVAVFARPQRTALRRSVLSYLMYPQDGRRHTRHSSFTICVTEVTMMTDLLHISLQYLHTDFIFPKYRNLSILNCNIWTPLVEFIYLVFTRMSGESYRRRFRSLLCLCDVFRALINSLVCWLCTNALGLILSQIVTHELISILQRSLSKLEASISFQNGQISDHSVVTDVGMWWLLLGISNQLGGKK